MAENYIKIKKNIDEAYLRNLSLEDDWHKMIDSDISDLLENDVVHLQRPKNIEFIPLYSDVMTHLAAKCIKGKYLVKFDNEYDVEKFKSILGNKVEGTLESGYKFKYVA